MRDSEQPAKDSTVGPGAGQRLPGMKRGVQKRPGLEEHMQSHLVT
jgi:hypothetical protein